MLCIQILGPIGADITGTPRMSHCDTVPAGPAKNDGGAHVYVCGASASASVSGRRAGRGVRTP
ncbi:hypothetical protein [Streptomyces sp. NBC_00388]|uniref:hypothetical protein n=1 Tax=Streptomyces sp. NBC_00388 TaxID=2975735 RepID=UPI002E1BF48B